MLRLRHFKVLEIVTKHLEMLTDNKSLDSDAAKCLLKLALTTKPNENLTLESVIRPKLGSAALLNHLGTADCE